MCFFIVETKGRTLEELQVFQAKTLKKSEYIGERIEKIKRVRRFSEATAAKNK